MAQLKDSLITGSLRVTDTIFSTNLNLSSLTASYAVITDANKNLTSKQFTNANTANTIVSRDANGNFNAGSVTFNYVTINPENETDEGGQLTLKADPNHSAYDANLDVYSNAFRIHSNGAERLTLNLAANGLMTVKGPISVGIREVTSTPSSLTYSNRITIIPYFHTGGPWYIKSADDSSSAYLALYYSSTELMRIKHNGTQQIDWKGNATSSTSTKWLMNRGGNTVTIDDSSWGIQTTPSGHTNRATVWKQKWAQSGLTYTPSGGSATAVGDTADLLFYLSSSNTANVLQLNMQIDGLIYALGGFKGNLIGNADTATKATQDGSGNTITTYYCTLSTDQTITGKKQFKSLIQAYRYGVNDAAHSLPFITFDKPGSYATGIGPDGTNNRIKFGPCPLDGSSWTAISSFNSNEWYFQGQITNTSSIVAGQYTANTAQSAEYQIKCQGGAGTIYLYSQAATTGNRGLYGYNSAGTAVSIITVNSSNGITLNGNCSGSSGSCTGNAATATTASYLTNIVANDVSRYGQYKLTGTKGGYYGFLLGTAVNSICCMATNSGGGFFSQNQRWILYYDISNDRMAIGSSTTASGYILNVSGNMKADKVYNAVWNDYAECRQVETEEAGYCVTETNTGTMIKTTERLQAGCKIISDTFGTCMGETDTAKTPIAVAGRVLAYPYRSRDEYTLGAAVCSAPNGTIDIMTRDEIMMYPERIIGTVSEIPEYDIWHGGREERDNDVYINGRIWIYVR